VNTFYQEFEDILRQRGFTYGGGRIDATGQHFYINIPKNASNYLDRLFAHSGWGVANLSTIDEKRIRCIMVLRDPVERWLSAFVQYAMSTMGEHVGQQFVDNYSPVVERLIFDQIVFDDHTMPQYYFFDRIKYQYNLDAFWYDNTVALRMASKYRLRLDQDFEANRTSANTDKQIMTDFLRGRLEQDPHLLSAVKNRYQEDYRLIHRTQLQ
jgi:hypothetical protein